MSDDANTNDDAPEVNEDTADKGSKSADKPLTVERALADFKDAYTAKAKLLARQKDDFLFRLGKQWDPEIVMKLEKAKIKVVTDNRIQPNIFLLTGLERQNRTDFKAFPEGEEDGLKAEIATDLFKDAIKRSDYGYKKSDAFEDGITCGESHLELYLDNTYNLINGDPCWKKINSNQVFPQPGFHEYDYSDADYVYKLTPDLSKEALINLYPEKRDEIEKMDGAKLDFDSFSDETPKVQSKDYKKYDEPGNNLSAKDNPRFDLLERYYKKWVDTAFVADYQTGDIKPAQDEQQADDFIQKYQDTIQQAADAHLMAVQQAQQTGQPAPVAPGQQDPNRFKKIIRPVPEIWLFAQLAGMDDPLCDERAWFYPKWKQWPIIPFYAHLSSAPIDGDDAHLLVQGLVYGVKGAQEQHNKAETLTLMHLNSAANSGWLSPKGAWTNEKKVEQFGSIPGVNLEYDGTKGKPERIFPTPLSQGHMEVSTNSAEAIKAILGINSDLLAQQEGSGQSGRAIALRQKQGLLMVQKLFDNLSRTTQICGRFLLTQLGEIYDTDTAKKVLGDDFLKKNFPTPMMPVPDTSVPQMPGMPPALKQVPAVAGPDGQLQPADPNNPPPYDDQMAVAAISAVLNGDLEQYDVVVGESVASDTMRMANATEVQDLAQKLPGVIPPEVLVESSMLDSATKAMVLQAIKQAQAAQQAMAQAQAPTGATPPMTHPGQPQIA